MCDDKMFILLILQIDVLQWYHVYLLHPGMDKAEAMVIKKRYLPVIRKSLQNEVSSSDTYQRTNKLHKILVN